MQALATRGRENVELMEKGHPGAPVPLLLWRALSAPVLGPLELDGISSPVAQGSLRRAQHLRDGEKIAVRANLTTKYEFILRSDLPEFGCIRGACSPGAHLPGPSA